MSAATLHSGLIFTNSGMIETSDIDILTLVPQRPPFLLIDRLVHFDMQRVETRFDVRPDNPLVREGRLSEAGLMENIAQTCAARIGYINVYILKEKIRIGMIGSVRNLVISFLPPVGSRLETEAELVGEVFNMTLIHARVKCMGRTAATCQMKISLTDTKATED